MVTFLWALAALLGLVFASGPQPPSNEGVVGATPAPTPTVVSTSVPPALAGAIQGTRGSHVPVSTPTPTPEPRVRAIYAVPADRSVERRFADMINTAVLDVQGWYAGQLDGLTFTVEGPLPQPCSLNNPAEYYAGKDGWWRVITGLQDCAPVEHSSDKHVWVVYVDVPFRCGEPRGELGAGGDGVTILHRGDLDGLSDPENFILCPEEGLPPRSAYGWIGGLAHEIGHAFGLPHPPGCEEDLNTCDYGALMWSGYYWDYPDTYLTNEDKAALRESIFFHHRLRVAGP